jgi:uncharacterized protein YdhG (YjbR/CyaY superfamily)
MAPEPTAVKQVTRRNQRSKTMWQCPNCGRDFKNTNQSHYCNSKLSTIDEYIASQPEELRLLLNKIRKTIKKAAPKAVEKISWRMPTFWQSENLIHFAAFKNHIGIYPGDLSRLPFKKQLAAYKTTKGAIQFPLDKPIDYNFIAEIAKFRLSVVTKREKP